MASVNKVIIIGNLGADPETRFAPSGDAIANIRVATTEKWKDKAGETQERTEWHSIGFFGKLAEVIGQYMKKGMPIYVEGKLTTRKWQDKEGNDRYTTSIVAQQMQMLGTKASREEGSAPGPRSGGSGTGEPAARKPAPNRGATFEDMDDDIPF